MGQYTFTVNKDDLIDAPPPGEHLCLIEKTEVKDTRDGMGQYISITFRIISDHCTGMKIFQMFNIVNKSEDTVRIGKKNLSRLCATIGIDSFNDTDEMVGKKTIVKLGPGNKLFGFNKQEDSQVNMIKDDEIPF